jgi:hypothetical protein
MSPERTRFCGSGTNMAVRPIPTASQVASKNRSMAMEGMIRMTEALSQRETR